jgi:hypothetical protein
MRVPHAIYPFTLVRFFVLSISQYHDPDLCFLTSVDALMLPQSFA